MTQQTTICTAKPNNFAMIPRLAVIELKGLEIGLYTLYVDLANSNTNQTRHSNKFLAQRVGCNVKTLKKHRNTLRDLGYIRLFYRQQNGQLKEITDAESAETWDAITVEVVDIWEANCQFAERYKQNYDLSVAVLKHYLLSPKMDVEGGKNDMGVAEIDDISVEKAPLAEIDMGGGKNYTGVEKNLQGGDEKSMTGGESKNTPNIINKDLLKEEVNKNQKNSFRASHDETLLTALENILDGNDESVEDFRGDTMTEKPETKSNDVWDKPYTPEEYEYYKDLLSLELLTSDVQNPCLNTSHVRTDFRKPKQTYTDWQKLIAVVQHYFPVMHVGYAIKIAQQLAGTAQSGLRKEFAIEPKMDAVTACAFAYWLKEGERLDQLPERAERIQERALQFMALPNYFEHVNYARYVLDDLMASLEPVEEPDPELFKPAPKEVLDKVYAEAEKLLGFSLSGDDES